MPSFNRGIRLKPQLRPFSSARTIELVIAVLAAHEAPQNAALGLLNPCDPWTNRRLPPPWLALPVPMTISNLQLTRLIELCIPVQGG